jgi:hypothetical protein
MKHLFLFCLSIFLFVSAAAQEDAKKMLKSAKRAMNTYYLDQNGNNEKLIEAKDLIDKVVADAAFASAYDAQYEKGKIYSELARYDNLMLSVNPRHKVNYPQVALDAQVAYAAAYRAAVKGYEKKDVLKGMAENMPSLLAVGYAAYQSGDQETAFASFEGALEAHYLMIENKEKSPFASDEEINNQIFIVAVTALGAKQTDKAEKYLKELIAKGAEKPEIYNALYQLMVEKGNDAMADKYLKDGRKKYPDDVNLLFSEINDALKKGKLDELIGRLKEAIAKEPENVSLYTTLGNVYDNLYQNATTEEKKVEYFDSAKSNYETALGKSSGNFDAQYSLGALYYNKAATLTNELNKLSDDLTAAGIKKYQEKQKQVIEVFKQALPYFLQAEKLNGKDKNTLIALKEIYARLNELDKSNLYKARLEALD